MRCILTHLKNNEDVRYTLIIYIFAKVRGKPYKIIVNNKNCINIVYATTILQFNLSTIAHPNPYEVSLVDTSFILIQK